MNKLIGKTYWTILVAVLLAGCGGSSGGTEPGIDRLGVRSGTVTGFGSIIVGDDRFNVDSAEFEVDDDSTGSGQDDLNVGDTVIVTFDPDVPGVAQTVFSDDAVEGPIDSIDLAGSRLVVAGQTVIVDALTSFDDSIQPPSLDGLTVDDYVEVNGFFDAVGTDQDGQIRATRIEPRLPGGEVEVKGFVEALDMNAMTFSINALNIDYSAADLSDLPNMTPANGDFVEVKGTNFGAGGELRATKVEPDRIGVDDGEFGNFDEVEAEIEGFITRFASATDFDVSGFPVTTTGGTVFEGGTAGDLGLNVKVEVDGDVNTSGVLVATKVDIRRSNDLRVAALVDDVDAAGGRLVVLGITVAVDDATRREDKSDAELEPFGLSQLNVNDYVEVRGGADPSGAADLLASILERDDPPDVLGEDTELRGFVDGIARPSFTIAGVTIETNGGTVFRDAAETVISADDFFDALQDGDLVDVDGTETAQTTIVADEVELEN